MTCRHGKLPLPPKARALAEDVRRSQAAFFGPISLKNVPRVLFGGIGSLVFFTPKGRPAGAGETDDAGRFVLNTLKKGDGAFQGACVVTVGPVAEFEEGSIAPKPRPDISSKYRVHETTPFKADVVAGKNNVFTFDMEK